MHDTVNLWPLIGIAVISLGFLLKFNPVLVVVTSGVVTGLAAHMSLADILDKLGSGFLSTRNLALILLLPLVVIGLLERHGLKERSQDWIAGIRSATAGRLLIVYLLARQMTAALGLTSLGGHPQMVRPLLAPMAEGAAESRYGLLKLPRELHMLYAVAQGTQAPLPPAQSYPDFAEAERREAEALIASDETVQRWRRCLEAFGGTLPPFPIDVRHPDATAPPQRGGYLELLDETTTRAFTQQCRAAGGDIFSGLFACLAKANRELTGNPAFHTMAPFQTQPSQWSASLGWYVGMAPVTFPLGEGETFETAIAHAAQGLQALKTLALVPITRVAELLGQPLRDTFMVSFMDLRRVPGAREWEKWRVVSFRSRSNDPDEVCLWFMRTHDGLIVDYRHPATPVADRVIADYIARIKRQLNAIAGTATWHAPSS